MLKYLNKTLALLKDNKKVLLVVCIVVYMLYRSYTKESFGLSQTGKELVFFSMPGCGHCEEFQPIWNLLYTNYGNTQHIDLVQVKSDEKPGMINRYGITAFPTILALKGGELVKEYEGDRSYPDLVRFMNYHISN